MILDHDSKYGAEIFASMHAMNITAVRTAVACPWQNGVAERWKNERPAQAEEWLSLGLVSVAFIIATSAWPSRFGTLRS